MNVESRDRGFVLGAQSGEHGTFNALVRKFRHRVKLSMRYTRKLGAHLDVSHMIVARVWRKHGLKPHRIERYMAANHPDFETKAANIIGLYLNPPAHAAVFCVDEKTAIQALDRKDPVLPHFAARAAGHERGPAGESVQTRRLR
jgi:hypothetical protein